MHVTPYAATQAAATQCTENFASVRRAYFFRNFTTLEDASSKLQALADSIDALEKALKSDGANAVTPRKLPEAITLAADLEMQLYINRRCQLAPTSKPAVYVNSTIDRIATYAQQEALCDEITAHEEISPEEKYELLRLLRRAYVHKNLATAAVDHEITKVKPVEQAHEHSDLPEIPQPKYKGIDDEFLFTHHCKRSFSFWGATEAYQHGIRIQDQVGKLVASLKYAVNSTIGRIRHVKAKKQVYADELLGYTLQITQLQKKLHPLYEAIFDLAIDQSSTKALLGYAAGLKKWLEQIKTVVDIGNSLLKPAAQSSIKLQSAMQQHLQSENAFSLFTAGLHKTRLEGFPVDQPPLLPKSVERLKALYQTHASTLYKWNSEDEAVVAAIIRQKPLAALPTNLIIKKISSNLFFTPEREKDMTLELLMYTLRLNETQYLEWYKEKQCKKVVDTYDKAHIASRKIDLLEKAAHIFTEIELNETRYHSRFNTLQSIQRTLELASEDTDYAKPLFAEFGSLAALAEQAQSIVLQKDGLPRGAFAAVMLRLIASALSASSKDEQTEAWKQLDIILESLDHQAALDALPNDLKELLYVYTAEKIYKHQQKPRIKEFDRYLSGPLDRYIREQNLPTSDDDHELALFYLIAMEKKRKDAKPILETYFRQYAGDERFERWFCDMSIGHK